MQQVQHQRPSPFQGVDPAAILERIQRGESLRQVADFLGVSHVAVRAWLLRCDEEAYADVVTAALTARVAESDAGLEAADDPVTIARAREQARFARMDLERRRPALYGQRQQVDMRVTTTDLSDRLRAAKARTVDGTAKRVDTVADAQQAVDNAVQQSASTDNRSQP